MYSDFTANNKFPGQYNSSAIETSKSGRNKDSRFIHRTQFGVSNLRSLNKSLK